MNMIISFILGVVFGAISVVVLCCVAINNGYDDDDDILNNI